VCTRQHADTRTGCRATGAATMWARPGVSMPLLAALLLLLAGPQQAVALPLQLSPAAIADIMASYGNTSNAQNYTMKAID